MKKLLFIVLTLSFFTGCSVFKKTKEKISESKIFKKLDKKERPDLYKEFHMIWAKNLDPDHESGNLPIGFASPIFKEGMLFQGNLKGEMTAYSANWGRVIWSHQEDSAINSKPVFFENNLIYGSQNGRLYSRDFKTGKLNYAIDLGSPIESWPSISEGRLFIHLRGHRVTTLDAATGKVLWSYKRAVTFASTLQRVSRPYISNNRVYVGFADGYLVAFNVQDGSIFWETQVQKGRKFVDIDVEPRAIGNYIVAGSPSGKLKYINTQNGIILKSLDVSPGHTPIYWNSNILVGGQDGSIFIYDRKAQLLKKKNISTESILAAEKWGDDLVISCEDGYLYRLNGADLSVKSKFFLGTENSVVFGHFATFKNLLGVYSSRNRLYVFKNTDT